MRRRPQDLIALHSRQFLQAPGTLAHFRDQTAKLDERRSRLTYARSFENVPMGQRLFYYLSHECRDTLASLRACLTGRRDWSLQGAQMQRKS